MPDLAAHYDVFLSHNGADKPAVESLAQRLLADGIRPWLDSWNLIPGDPWQEGLEEALDTCATCAVFLGPAGVGPWHNEELRVALDRRVRDRTRGFRVIPVLLPGSDPADPTTLPRFLSRMAWVDFRGGLDDAGAFRRLVAGIRGVAPGPGSSPTPQAVPNPYLGLRYFDVKDAVNYHGRDGMVDKLLAKLGQTNLVAVVGPSGSGKSSLVRAGLVPSLQAGALPDSQDWGVEFMRPGSQPIQALAVSLKKWSQPEQDETDRLAEAQRLAQHLQAGTLDLSLVLNQLPRGTPRYLLVVDQFEEAFTLCDDTELRGIFIDALLTVASQPCMTVLLAVRADYASHLLADPSLGARADQGWVNVLSMTREERRLAVEKPGLDAGATFEAGLVDRIVDAIKDAPGDLPALQFALTRLWEKRSAAGVLSLKAYEDFGGVSGVIAERADKTLANLNAEQIRTLQEVFTRLVRLTMRGGDIEITRRRAERDDLPAEGWSLVEQLADARLLVTDRDPGTGKETVEVAHEALIRKWPVLSDWVKADYEFLTWRESFLEKQFHAWQQVREDPGSLLRGETLRAARDWLTRRPRGFSPAERDFVFHSLLHEEGDLSGAMDLFAPPEEALAFLDGYLNAAQVSDQARGVNGLRLLHAPAVAPAVNERLQWLVLTHPAAAIRNRAAEALAQRGQTAQLVQLLDTARATEERDHLVDSLATIRNLPELGPQVAQALPQRAFKVRLEAALQLASIYRAEFAIVLSLAYLLGTSSLIAFSIIDDLLYQWFNVRVQGQLVVPLNTFDVLVALGAYLAIYVRKRFIDAASMVRRDWLLVALAGSLVSILLAIFDRFPDIRNIVSGQLAQVPWFTLAYRVIDELGRFVLLFVMAWQLRPEVANRAVARRSLRTTFIAMAAAVLTGLALFVPLFLLQHYGRLALQEVTPYGLFGILSNSLPRWINTVVVMFFSLIGFQWGLRIAFPERFPRSSSDAVGKKRLLRRALIAVGIVVVVVAGALQLNARYSRSGWLYCAITAPGEKSSAILLGGRGLVSGPSQDSPLIAGEPLPAGACVAILGRDDSGQWLYVQRRGQRGWLYNDAGLDRWIDVKKVPVRPGD
jgi:hypothetical protein